MHGWSGRGMLLAPICAALLVRQLVTGEADALLRPFDPARLVGVPDEAGHGTDYYGTYAKAGRQA